MGGVFTTGVYVNKPRGEKLLRITAGPQRNRYVHQLVLEAKIIGRREAFAQLMPGFPLPEHDSFYSLDYETVEHDNGNSLDCSPGNLLPMTQAENTRRMRKRVTRQNG